MEHFWEIAGYLGTAFTGTFFGWLFSRKKEKVELEGSKVQNFDAAIEAYKKMYEDMIEDLKDQNNQLKAEVESLKQELSENRKQIITLTNFVLASAIQSQKGELGNLEDLKDIIK
jgi:peptidoglycan hydrolase CwlO-like protein